MRLFLRLKVLQITEKLEELKLNAQRSYFGPYKTGNANVFAVGCPTNHGKQEKLKLIVPALLLRTLQITEMHHEGTGGVFA